ncbi:HNH endonuclease [Sunxiuqinia elliptica]|uniref:Putative restriction endonuclease n=1 Tax=Sunxiuqinia elliptica TaxID=655355 RepID=A0A4R6H8C4_9BACT|nr:HNH endonuclease [Sunxiuqinia elliptica]TDO03861.1 putative restriction endonuclease [Sunxiuqinia elliptica]TDO62143.1 putative restriction endonuclease [Sunxiuqinia elliptica]
MKRRLWTREELILALSLYLKLPFGKIHHQNPDIIELAQLIDRTPSAVSMRLSNFASVDPFHQKRGIKGLVGGIKQVQPIWNEFMANKDELLFESEQVRAVLEYRPLEQKYGDVLSGVENLKGEVKTQEVKVRVNQHVFRKIVLVNYNTQCAVTSINIPEMLIASHIIPWSANEEERLNPSNGICLSAHFDKAFDKGFITFDEKYKLVLSPSLKDYSTKDYFSTWFQRFEGARINMPQKYLPHLDFMAWHRENIYKY